MSMIVLLFLAGVLFIAIEVIVPGGILGVFGGIALVSAVTLSFVSYGVITGFVTAIAAILLVALTVWLEFKILPATSLGRRFFLNAEIKGASQPALAERQSVIGQGGVADTTLAPTGYVVVDGKRYEAFSRSGLIPKGDAVRVVELDSFRLVVQKN